VRTRENALLLKVPSLCCRDDKRHATSPLSCRFGHAEVTIFQIMTGRWNRSGCLWSVMGCEAAGSCSSIVCVCSVWELGRWGLCFNNMVPPIEEMNQKASVFLWRGFPGKSEILPLKDENFNLPTLWPKPGNHAPCFQERIGIRWCMRACDLEVRKLRSER